MNIKAILIPLIAVLAVFLVGIVSAESLTYDVEASFNDVVLSNSGMTMAGIVGDSVPVRISFVANTNAEDVRVKVWMEGYRDDVSVSTKRFNVVEEVTYPILLSLNLPKDLKDTTKDYVLHVSVSSSDNYFSEQYQVKMQRKTYDFSVLSMDYELEVSAGSVVPISVVIENTGMQELEDGYVIVSIPALGVSAKGYFGDLVAVENTDDKQDSLQKTVYLKIPANAQAGIYDVIAKVYNRETTSSVKDTIKVGGTPLTTVIAALKSQDIKVGETKTYDLIIVNSEKKVRVYNIQTISGNALQVSAPSAVTVSPDSSTIVPVSVSPVKNAQAGSYTFTVNVDGNQAILNANVVQAGKITSTSVVALTVVLVIIFVVLLAVLIVLLTKKEKSIEEVETSYY